MLDVKDLPTINGWQKFSTCDYPGMITTTVFTQGCPLACVFCYNVELQPLVNPNTEGSVSWVEVFDLLENRRGMLDGLVISGGEPLVHRHVDEVLRRVRALDMVCGLHTCGMYPQRLQPLLREGLLDWVGLDIKATPVDYPVVTGHKQNFYLKVIESLRLIKEAGVSYELRMTTHPSFTHVDTLRVLSETGALQGEHLVLQRAKTGGDVVYEWSDEDNTIFEEMVSKANGFTVSVR